MALKFAHSNFFLRAYGSSVLGYIFGGFTGTESLASVDGLYGGEWSFALNDIPVKVHHHCTATVLGFLFIVIGGIQDGVPSKKTFIYDALGSGWKEGPELNVPRISASCGSNNNNGQFIVTGGSNENGYLSSTEV